MLQNANMQLKKKKKSIYKRKTEGLEVHEELNAKYGFRNVDCIRKNS